jgi:hypothetical protein
MYHKRSLPLGYYRMSHRFNKSKPDTGERLRREYLMLSAPLRGAVKSAQISCGRDGQ